MENSGCGQLELSEFMVVTNFHQGNESKCLKLHHQTRSFLQSPL